MLKTWFDQFKWYAIAILFLVYSVGVWNVSADVRENEFNAERLRLATNIIRIQDDNLRLNGELSSALSAKLTAQAEASAKDLKDLKYALSKSTVYTTCRNTDSVRELYKRKLQAQ